VLRAWEVATMTEACPTAPAAPTPDLAAMRTMVQGFPLAVMCSKRNGRQPRAGEAS
jgi:hypothetical protein